MPISQLNKKNTTQIIIPRSHSDWNKKPISSKKRNNGNNKKSLLRRFISWFFVLMIIGIIFGSISIGGAILWFSKDLPDPDKLMERTVPLSTKIFDRTGENLLYEIHGAENRTFVPLSDIPVYATRATIAIEDKNFFTHKGVSIWGIFRGVVISKLKGTGVQGGSTITQQFIKNSVLSDERTVSRKIKEWILAWRIEKKFTKDEILQLYFNEIPYGSTAYGIDSASNLYFGKSAKDLTIAESAVLAALPKAPTYYSPYGSNKDKLIGRQQYILGLMLEQGYIDQQQYDDAMAEELNFKRRQENITAPHFVMYIKEVLTEKYGEKIVEQGGLQVITTLDLYKQKIAEEVITEYAPINEEKYGATNEALVAIDPKTGQILAMVGSRDYFDMENDGNVNVAIRLRQPGSSLKPLVYATAFTLGYRPETILYDVNTNFGVQGAQEYIPHDYDNKERGPISIRSSLAGSLNIPAVKALYLTGMDRVISQAEKMGYTTLSDKNRFGLSLVLGGGEVKLLEHTSAYGVFARDGLYNPATGILEVKDSEGKIIEEYKQQERQVMDSESVRLLNDVLTDNEARSYVFGANSSLYLGNRPVAAKTGTTNDYKDAWIMGYTPSLVTGVWTGNNNGDVMSSGGANAAGPIWNKFMRTVLGDPKTGTPIEYFAKPKEIDRSKYENKPILIGELQGEEIVKIDKFSQKLATEFTPAEAIEEKPFKQMRSILHYVDRNNPLGPIPENPEQDPQYRAWEEGIANWIKSKSTDKENPLPTDLPPTEYDDVHISENIPEISILNVSDNQLITNEEFYIDISTEAKRGISKVEYLAGDTPIGTTTEAPYDLFWIIDIPNGTHNLRAIAYDDVLNKKEISIPINININDTPLQTTWLRPFNNQTFTNSNYPLSVSFVLSRVSRIKKVDVYYNDISNPNDKNLITSIIKPTNKNINIEWNTPPNKSGQYRISTVTTDVYDSRIPDQGVVIDLK